MPEMWGYLIFTENGEEYPLPEDRFTVNALYKLFYREHIYSVKNGIFTADATLLLGEEASLYKICAYITPGLFEGTAVFNGILYHIDQDGYLWKGDER